ncbi:TPA: DNA primase, partial [Salmonella enterica]
IEQAVSFLSTFGMRRFAPLPYDEQSLPINELAGYRSKGNHSDDPVLFYVLPTVFRTEVARGFDSGQFASTLCEAGILKKSPSDKGYQTLTPRLRHMGNIRLRSYLLVQLDESEGAEQ